MPRIACLTSFRAGAGKTTIAANLAALMVAEGKRVCLVDANFQMPELHTMFKIKEHELPESLADFLLEHCTIEEALVNITPRLNHPVSGQLHLITALGKSNLAAKVQAEGFNLQTLKDGLDMLSHTLDLDYILVDTYAGLDERTLPLIAIVDVLLVVMLLDKQDYQGISVLVEVARRIAVPSIWLIINSIAKAFDPLGVKTEAEQAYQCPVVGVVPHDIHMLEPLRNRTIAIDHLDQPIPTALRPVISQLLNMPDE